MIHKQGLALAFAIVTSIGAFSSVGAQNPTQNNQPIRGELHQREADLKARLQRLYDGGRIDSTILAKMQRDLDGICSDEDMKRSKNDGMTSGAKDSINKKLDLFEEQLASKETGK